MGHSDFIQITLENKSLETLKTENVYAHWGKFYAFPDKHAEVDIGTVANQTFGPKKSFKFASCGRENASSGTEGQLDVMHGTERLFQLYWCCPYIGQNKVNARYVAEGWVAAVSEFSESGAIGPVTIKVINVGM